MSVGLRYTSSVPDKTPNERPAPRDKTVSTRIPPEVHQAAQKRAHAEGRNLSAILRAFLTLFAKGDAPSPPMTPDEAIRAKKRLRPAKTKSKRRR